MQELRVSRYIVSCPTPSFAGGAGCNREKFGGGGGGGGGGVAMLFLTVPNCVWACWGSLTVTNYVEELISWFWTCLT